MLRHSRAVLIALAACSNAPKLDERAQPIIGGADDAGDPAVVALTIAGGQCSGVAVAPRVVVTAAHCAKPGVGRSDGTADFGAVTPSAQTAHVVDVWIDRYYAGDVDHDLAAVRLDADAPATVAIGAPAIGAPVRLVGYGETSPGDDSSRGTRRSVATELTAVTAGSATAGTAGATTCLGDSGGAALDASGALVGTVSAGDDACDAPAQLARPDSEPQLAEVIAAWSGPCPADGTCDAACATPDPDCAPCAFNGTCDAACATVNLDCPLGGAPGATCGAATDCESRDCAPVPEGSAFGSYCSAPCATAAECTPPLAACIAGTCAYSGGTPGIAGTSCTQDSACRAGPCDPSVDVCTQPCGADDACPSGLACVPVGAGRACSRSAGCAAGGGSAWGALPLVAIVAARRRRRTIAR